MNNKSRRRAQLQGESWTHSHSEAQQRKWLFIRRSNKASHRCSRHLNYRWVPCSLLGNNKGKTILRGKTEPITVSIFNNWSWLNACFVTCWVCSYWSCPRQVLGSDLSGFLLIRMCLLCNDDSGRADQSQHCRQDLRPIFFWEQVRFSVFFLVNHSGLDVCL